MVGRRAIDFIYSPLLSAKLGSRLANPLLSLSFDFARLLFSDHGSAHGALSKLLGAVFTEAPVAAWRQHHRGSIVKAQGTRVFAHTQLAKLF
jgi:hypothetical protein